MAGQPSFCYICNGARGPIRYDLKYPHPLSPSVDHIIPAQTFDHLPEIERAAAMYDESNLAVVHKQCNDEKLNASITPRTLKPNPGQEW